MVATIKVTGVDGPLFKRALLGSLTWLSANHEEVNRLNVFPVPDGDTETNMLLTLQSAVEDIKESDAAEVSKIAKLASHGSLMGARGNSGVILSQIFRGFARAVEGKSSLTPAELAAAFEEAANAAYRAVNKPTEGTILTVAREAGRSAATAAGTLDRVMVASLALLAMASFEAVAPLPAAARVLRSTIASGRRLLDITGQAPSVVDPSDPADPPRDPAVTLEQVGFGYANEESWALDDVSFRLAPGRKVALVGRSGAGKSTIAALMVRFLDPDTGRITVGATDTRALRQQDVRSLVTLDAQEAYLFSTTIRENVRLTNPSAGDDEMHTPRGKQSTRDPETFQYRVHALLCRKSSNVQQHELAVPSIQTTEHQVPPLRRKGPGVDCASPHLDIANSQRDEVRARHP